MRLSCCTSSRLVGSFRRNIFLWVSFALVLGACGKSSEEDRNNERLSSGGDGDDSSLNDEEDNDDGSPLIDDVSQDDGEGGDDQCRREVSLEGVMLTTPPPFDVVIVADNSESLSWSREDLAQGLSDLVANVHGHDVRISVLTPTQFGESSADAVNMETGEPLVNWRDPLSLTPYTSPVARYTTTCSDDLGNELVCPSYPPPSLDFELEGEWNFVMPEPIAELRSDMTPGEVDAERTKVVDSILGLGVNGAPEEQPLCTLTRYMQQHAARLPERAVFLVIADEDDTNSGGGCLGQYEYRHFGSSQGVRDYNCTDCEVYEYRMSRTGARNRLNFSCAVVDDLGTLAPEDTWQQMSIDDAFTETCEGASMVSCTPEQEERALRECRMGDRVVECMRACSEDSASVTCGLSSLDPEVDFCSESLPLGDQTFDNLLAFCNRSEVHTNWSACTRRGFNYETGGATWRGNGSTRPLVAEQSPSALIRRFHDDATKAFGPENYFVESIVFTPDGPCTPASGQSYANELMSIASSPEQVHPICESYAPALTNIDQFAQRLLQTDYTVVLKERESIEGVTVESLDGTSRQLTGDDYLYDESTGQLKINQEALVASDLQLSVEVVDPCVPIVR